MCRTIYREIPKANKTKKNGSARVPVGRLAVEMDMDLDLDSDLDLDPCQDRADDKDYTPDMTDSEAMFEITRSYKFRTTRQRSGRVGNGNTYR